MPQFESITKDFSEEPDIVDNTLAVIKIQATWKMYKQKIIHRKMLEKIKNEKLLKAQEELHKRSEEERRIKLKNNLLPGDIQILRNHFKTFDTSYNDMKNAIEDARTAIIQNIKENIAYENRLNELDAKVALLIKNRVKTEKVGYIKSKYMHTAIDKYADQGPNLISGIFSLKGSDKVTIAQRKNYGQLVYVLQTEPVYLATLTTRASSQQKKLIEQIVSTIFGQNPREQYLFIKLIEVYFTKKECFNIQLSELKTPNDLLTTDALLFKLLQNDCIKSVDYFKKLIDPLLDYLKNNKNLELNTCPQDIYISKLKKEEQRSGRKSVSYDKQEQYMQDPEIVESLIQSIII
jgi:hypothetical protein